MLKFILKNKFIFLLTLLILIALFFPRPIQIVDVITRKPVDFIELKISWIRILFEPVLGVMFYLARGHQALREHFVSLFWLLGIYLFIAIIDFWKNRHNFGLFWPVLTYWIRKLSVLPLIFLMILTHIAFNLFIPLPTNTIRSKNPDKILIDFHSHTTYSHDGLITPRQQIKWHKRNGFDAFFLTDHNVFKPAFEFVTEYEKQNTAENEPVLLCGMEFSGDSHLLLLGIDTTLRKSEYQDETVIQKVRQMNGLVFVAHWWSLHKHSPDQYVQWGVDGFEIAKQGQDIDLDPEIFSNLKKISLENKLFLLGTTDYHGYGSFCYTWSVMELPGFHSMDYFQKKSAIWNTLLNRDPDAVRVIAYDDRPVISGMFFYLIPWIHLVNYFRTLNFWQLFSWLIWSIFFFSLGKSRICRKLRAFLKKKDGLFYLAMIGLLCGACISGIGYHFLEMAPEYKDYNEILFEFGALFKNIGWGFVFYSLFVGTLSSGIISLVKSKLFRKTY